MKARCCRFITYGALRYTLIIWSLFLMSHSINSQPFDTLLLNYQYISEIYPLADSTFILIGEGKKIMVERINHKAEIIWSTSFGEDVEDDVYKTKLHLNATDSAIQVLTTKHDCDLYTYDKIAVYNLSLSGEILDSLYLPEEIITVYADLLSGEDYKPRLSFIKDEDIYFVWNTGETIILKPKMFVDSTLHEWLGSPKHVAMCPNGDFLVGMTGIFLLSFRYDNGIFSLSDIVYAPINFRATDLFCVEDGHFITVNSDGMEVWSMDGYSEKSFYPEKFYLESVSWRNPYLNVHGSIFPDYEDTLYLFDAHLNQVYKEPTPLHFFSSSYAIHEGITYGVGSGYPYNEGGFLGSVNQITAEGPKYDNIEFIDFSLPGYDSYSIHDTLGPVLYVYHFPEMEVLIKNHGDYTKSQVTIANDYVGFCGPIISWQQTIQNMDLKPGETKAYTIKDVIIANPYPYHYPLYSCFWLMRADNRPDDEPFDNSLCKKIPFSEINPFEPEEKVKYFPNPVVDKIFFVTPEVSVLNVDIYDLKGNLIMTHAHQKIESHLKISDLASGIYILKFIFENGETENGKIVKI